MCTPSIHFGLTKILYNIDYRIRPVPLAFQLTTFENTLHPILYSI